MSYASKIRVLTALVSLNRIVYAMMVAQGACGVQTDYSIEMLAIVKPLLQYVRKYLACGRIVLC